MAEHKPINWAYPFPSKDTSNNPLQLLTHMAQAKAGSTPPATTAYGMAACTSTKARLLHSTSRACAVSPTER